MKWEKEINEEDKLKMKKKRILKEKKKEGLNKTDGNFGRKVLSANLTNELNKRNVSVLPKELVISLRCEN
jgi:hypothetical protein